VGVQVPVESALPLVPGRGLPDSLRDAALSRQADYLAGRLAAEEAVRLLTGQAAPVGRTEEGAPAWPDGLEGSISHHEGLACAVARPVSCGIGIDMAPLLDGPALRAVVRRCLAEDERAQWCDAGRATLAFAAKECIFKAAHARVQRFIGFDEAALVDDSDDTWTAVLGDRLSADLGIDAVTGTYAWEGRRLFAVVALSA
ncbi:MAG: 4'-phosphopantetheinyl transferase family protein, partial [Candidatus Nanopelagicales bacterium]